jgi:hypothetical protein
VLRQDLEPLQRLAHLFLRVQQQRARVLDPSHTRPQHRSLGHRRDQPQGGGADDPQRSLRADQQLL